MSRTGCCHDNAVMERLFWSLKHEWTKHEEYADLEEARLNVFRGIVTFVQIRTSSPNLILPILRPVREQLRPAFAGQFVLQESTYRGLSHVGYSSGVGSGRMLEFL
jgi:transposase InsO family protein